MVSAIHNAISGLHAAARRVEAGASNVANARNSIPLEDARVEEVEAASEARHDRREHPVYEPVRVHQETVAGGGVKSEFIPVEPPHVVVYDPEDPVAGEEGLVAHPNVDYASEIVNLMQAENAYKANLRAMRTEDRMIGSLFDQEL